jgi:RNA polymerase sigma-70 factor (ECF subfamily)
MNNYQLIEDYYCAHKDDLLAFVSARIHNPEEAKDVVQNVFLRLLSTDCLIGQATLPGLAITLCRNQIADWYRRHSVRQDAEHELARTSGSGASAESLLSMREITEQIEHSLARVPADCRDLYRMHIYDGMPVRNICQLSGQPYKTVEYRLGLARKQVRKNLQHVV